MGAKFQRLGPMRKSRYRERLLFIGGSSLMMMLVIVGVLLVYNQATPVEAVTSESKEDNFLGTVKLFAPISAVVRGTKLEPTQVREIHWPRDQVPEGAVRYIYDIQGMYASVNLIEGQPILRSTLAPTPPATGIVEVLPPGHRAVTIEVDATSGVEGWATPGAHVDVYVTYLDSNDGLNKTRVAVENAVVLSYGGSVTAQQPNELTARARQNSTVTLAVAATDSLKIQTARAMGRITLALRHSNDKKSSGVLEFVQNEWEAKPKREEKRFVPNAFARYTNPDGKEETMFLSNDNKWRKADAGDE